MSLKVNVTVQFWKSLSKHIVCIANRKSTPDRRIDKQKITMQLGTN